MHVLCVGKEIAKQIMCIGCRQCEREIEGMYTNLFLNECGRVLKDEKEEKPSETQKNIKKIKMTQKRMQGGGNGEVGGCCDIAIP